MVKEIKKVLVTTDDRQFYVYDLDKDVHTQFGFISSASLKKAKAGDTLVTNKGKKMVLIEPSFIDMYKKIKRGAQIIPRKDVGLIILETGIGKDSIVVDAGAGSGALSCYLANVVKKVYTFDVRQDHVDIVQHNIEFLALNNITVKLHDIYLGIPVKNFDVLSLDLPEPWLVLSHLDGLKHGGFIVSYSPTIPQVMDFVSAVEKTDDLVFIKTVEVILREWEVNMRKVRPMSRMMGHSGFLTFVRKL